MSVWAFDIETGPASDEAIEALAPEFKPEDVKTGNLTDLKKIADKVEGARVEHFAAIKKKAALRAEYSELLALGWNGPDGLEILHRDVTPEPKMLSIFWHAAQVAYQGGHTLAGHCIKSFDLPYLARRSFVHGVVVPRELRPQRLRFWPYMFFDTAEAWSFGDPQSRIGLDRLARFLGLEGKNGTGEHFGKLYNDDQVAALAYLEQDLKVSKAVAEKLWQTLEAGGIE